MSSYGHFIVEVKYKDTWKRVYWKSDASLYPYKEEIESSQNNDYIHEFCTVGQFYKLRDALRSEDFGHTNSNCGDFSEETKKTLDKWKGDYGWFEGYFYLNELNNFIRQKKQEIDKLKSKNMQQAIYDEVRKIYAKLCNEEFKKDEKENIPFDEYYEEDIVWLNEELIDLQYISSVVYFIVDECCGYTETSDIRVIVVAG